MTWKEYSFLQKCNKYVTQSVKMRLFCVHHVVKIEFIIKVYNYILPLMVDKILKSDNPKGSYAHLAFGV